ncbi:MAG: methyltransferase [Bryobacteraceae bacterium]
MYPIHLGAPEDFAIARDLLAHANFNEPAIAARLGVPLLTQRTIDQSSIALEHPTNALETLTRIFVLGGLVDGRTVQQHISPLELESLSRLGLFEDRDGSFYSPVCLCPVAGVHTVSDRWRTPDGQPLEGLDDIVYPAVVPNTRLFLDLLPRSRCESLLDLCSGTGVAALIASAQYATAAHAYDIAPRSIHFAEFAKRLNGLENFTTGTGDLYDPAGATTFDRIVAHPPYVPALESKWIFYSGGDDGEHVTRRIVEQLPRHLRPGGTLYCLAMASDRKDSPLEQRVREWLGTEHTEFDIAVVVRRTLEPHEFAFDSLVRSEDAGLARKWKELFESRGIVALAYSMIMVQRKAAGREPFTVRRQTGPKSGRAEHEWLLDWETQAAANPEAVLDMRLRASPQCELRTLHRLEAGDWEPAGYMLAIGEPFRMEMKIDPWIAYLLARCDGTKITAEIFAALKDEEVIQADTPLPDFIGVIRALISGGFLTAG